MSLAKPMRLLAALLLVAAAVWYQQRFPAESAQPVPPSSTQTTTGQPARGWSRTDPEVNLTHVFFGEINASGKPVGFHARPSGSDPAGARVRRVLSGPNRAGVYTAQVEIAAPGGGWREKFSSFFPDRMDQQQVLAAVLNAYRNRGPGGDQPWEGPSGQGFLIQGYLSRRGGINTAYPVYRP